MQIGDMVYTEETCFGFKPTYGVIVGLDKIGEDEEAVWDLKVMVNDVGFGGVEGWCVSEPEWDEELGAWTFYWS